MPVVSTAGDSVSDMIASRGLGRTVPPERPDLLSEAILSMLADDGLRDRMAERARAVRDELAWARVVEPIATFLEHATFAPDALAASRTAAEARRTIVQLECLESRSQQLEQERDWLRDHVSEIRQGRVMRVLNTLDNWLSVLKGRK